MEQQLVQHCIKMEQIQEITEPKRPPPPIVGKVTHHSVELYWEDALHIAAKNHGKGDSRVRVCIQEQDLANSWGNVYVGYSSSHVLEGLEPQTDYKYRIRFLNDIGPSEWSAVTSVATTKEPLTGEHLHKRVMLDEPENVARILETGDVYVDVNDKYGFSPLMRAAQKGCIEIMDILIHHGADVNLANDSGKTSMMYATFACQLDAVRLLRCHGARFDVHDKGGSCAIHSAVDGGNVELIQWMIEDGAGVNTKDTHTHWTPLHRTATFQGNHEAADLLIQCGADINATDKDGKTPLIIAVINGHLKLVETLLHHHADISVQNEYKKTAYEMAICTERKKITQAFENHMDKLGIKYRK